MLMLISPILILKLVAMATSLEQSEKENPISNLRSNTCHYGENLVKNGQMNPEIGA